MLGFWDSLGGENSDLGVGVFTLEPGCRCALLYHFLSEQPLDS